MTTPGPSGIRTLTEALRLAPPEFLVRLLDHRPDLRYPLPTGLADLAARATTSTSVARAVDSLNSWQRLVCEALAASLDPTSVADVAALVGADEAAVARAWAELTERALCWGEPSEIHLVRAVRDVFGPYPGGLAAPSQQPLSSDQITAALDQVGSVGRPVLDRLLWGPPTGAVRNAERTITLDAANTPVERLLALRLLRPLDADTVLLPREVALAVRAPATLTTEPVPAEAPVLSGRQRGAALVTRAAAGAAFALLHDADLVAATLEETPHRMLRSGGLASRDVAAMARRLDADVGYAVFLVELLAAARLVAVGPRNALLPTGEFDRWLLLDAGDRWRALVAAWRTVDRWPALSAEPGSHALDPGSTHPRAAEARAVVLTQLFAVEPGTVVDPEDLVVGVRWARPSLDSPVGALAAAVRWTWQEAEWLGLTALKATSGLGAVALDPEQPLPSGLAELFPEPVEQLVIQSDLTAVAPGPLTTLVAAELRLLADQESRGGGGVYRFSAGSLRRAFDAGWSSAQVHGWIESHSRTEVPQPLRYLIDDAGRQHGTIRVGPARSFVRCDDPAQAATLLGHADAARLGLRALAPGLLAADADPDEVVDLLRVLGLSPAAENAAGDLLTTPARPRAKSPSARPNPTPIGAADAAEAVLAADRRAPAPRVGDDLSSTLRLLESAARAETTVDLSYLGNDGLEIRAELAPLGLGGGLMRAVDTSSRRIVNVPISRISSVRSTAEEQ